MALGKNALATIRANKLKAEVNETKAELRAVKRAAKAEIAQIVVIGGLSATAGAVAGAKLQSYLNENYDAESKLRALTPEVPTLTILGAVVAVAGAGMAKDNTTRAVIAGIGGGIAGGAYVEGTGLV